MKRVGSLVLLRALLLAALLPCAMAADDATVPKPDLTGVWLPDAKASGRAPQDRPYTAQMRALRDRWTKAHAPVDETRDDDHTSCLPYTLPYLLTTITQYPFEIVSTPKRLYVFTEVYGQVRRIELDAAAAPRDALPSRTGTSRGHWEGSQLVVETTNILTENEGSRYPSSPALRVVERLSLEEGGPSGKRLVSEITLHDPKVYEKPISVRMVYKAAPGIALGEYLCPQDLWDQHLDGSSSRIPWR